MDMIRPNFQPGSATNTNRLAAKQGEVVVNNQQVQRNDQSRSFLSAQLGSRNTLDLATFSTTFVAPVQTHSKKLSEQASQSRFGAITNTHYDKKVDNTSDLSPDQRIPTTEEEKNKKQN